MAHAAAGGRWSVRYVRWDVNRHEWRGTSKPRHSIYRDIIVLLLSLKLANSTTFSMLSRASIFTTIHLNSLGKIDLRMCIMVSFCSESSDFLLLNWTLFSS